MSEASTSTCAEALLSNWVSRFGVPDDITTDRGSTFISELWAALANLMGTKLHNTTAYNSEANGIVERAHRTLKAALMARCTNEHWKAQFPWVLLGLRTASKSDTGVSPAEMVFGEALAVPGKFFPTNDGNSGPPLSRLRDVGGKYVPCKMTYTDRKKILTPKGLKACRHVFIRNDTHRTPFTRPYRGPYQVIVRTAKTFKLKIHGQVDRVSIDRLKPAFLLGEEDPPEEEGRRPRIPPQNRQQEQPQAKRGRPKQRPPSTVEPPSRGGILSEAAPQLASIRLGKILPPKRYRD